MNPLLQVEGLPKFSLFHVEHIEPAVKQVLEENKQTICNLVNEVKVPTWHNFVKVLESLEDRLSKVWGPVSHLDSVKNSDEWHQAYTNCLPWLTEYATFLGQNEGLFKLYAQLKASSEYQSFTVSQKRVIENAIRDFRLSGIDLSAEDRQKYKEISQALSEKTSAFGNHVLKSTQDWQYLISDKHELDGLPESALALLEDLRNKNPFQVGE